MWRYNKLQPNFQKMNFSVLNPTGASLNTFDKYDFFRKRIYSNSLVGNIQ